MPGACIVPRFKSCTLLCMLGIGKQTPEFRMSQMMELGLEAIGERLHGDGLRPLTADELSGLIR